MSRPSFRFGLIGCGHIGATADDRAAEWVEAAWWLPLSHASAIVATEGAELVADCDVNEAAARTAGARYGAPGVYTDFRALLAREQLDAVSIATRTPERRAIIEACIAAGVQAIFCEKPLCQSLEAADALCAALRAHGIHFIYGTRRRFMPIYRHARAEIAAGRIGDVRTVIVRFGKAPLLWTVPHSVDIASFFAGDGEVEFAQAELELDPALVTPACIDADPIVSAGYLGFRNGVRAHLLASDSFDVEIIGSTGAVTVLANGQALEWQERRQTATGRVDVGSWHERRREENTTRLSGTVVSIQTLVGALRGEMIDPYDPIFAVRNQEMLFGMVYSHLDGGRRIPFPPERRGLVITGRMGKLYP
jgi:predicted dehydrogenase